MSSEHPPPRLAEHHQPIHHGPTNSKQHGRTNSSAHTDSPRETDHEPRATGHGALATGHAALATGHGALPEDTATRHGARGTGPRPAAPPTSRPPTDPDPPTNADGPHRSPSREFRLVLTARFHDSLHTTRAIRHDSTNGQQDGRTNCSAHTDGPGDGPGLRATGHGPPTTRRLTGPTALTDAARGLAPFAESWVSAASHNPLPQLAAAHQSHSARLDAQRAGRAHERLGPHGRPTGDGPTGHEARPPARGQRYLRQLGL